MKKRNSRVFISLLLIAIMIAASCFVPGIGVHAATSMKIQFYNQDRNSSSNQLYTNFKIVNTGTTAIDLTKVKLRYYFSDSGRLCGLGVLTIFTACRVGGWFYGISGSHALAQAFYTKIGAVISPARVPARSPGEWSPPSTPHRHLSAHAR